MFVFRPQVTPPPHERLTAPRNNPAFGRGGLVDARLTESHLAMRRQIAIATAATLYPGQWIERLWPIPKSRRTILQRGSGLSSGSLVSLMYASTSTSERPVIEIFWNLSVPNWGQPSAFSVRSTMALVSSRSAPALARTLMPWIWHTNNLASVRSSRPGSISPNA